MKNLIVVAVIIAMFSSCEQQKQRYFAESAETKILESGIAAYESGDWDTWQSHFADSAKIFVNSKEPMTIESRRENLAAMTEVFSSYGFEKDNAFIEMVIDKEDETWVYYWAQHSGTMVNGTEISMPVHLAVQFTNGKITSEHVYYDATAMNSAIAAMAVEAEIEDATDEMASE